MQCSSYLKDISRCPNKTIGDSHHCDIHREKAKKLYLKYKSLSDICENIPPIEYDDKINVDEQISTIMSYYIMYNNSLSAREKHRKYSFVTDLHDEGHNYQFEKLNLKLLKCETILSELYDIKLSKDIVDVKIIKKDKEPKRLNIQIKSEIKRLQTYRKNIKAESDDYINKCIEENKILLEEKKKLISQLSKCVYNLFLTLEKDEINIYVYNFSGEYILIDDIIKNDGKLMIGIIPILIVQLVVKLYTIGFFNNVDDLKYDNKLISFDIIKCESSTIEEFLLQYSVTEIKNIYQLILYSKRGIQKLLYCLITDLVNIYLEEIHERRKSATYSLFWNNELKQFWFIPSENIININDLICI